jgi:hypothetical protein
MFHETYEQMTHFGSDGGEFPEELKRARAEFEQRTGEMFETDQSFERRIAAFLEWYVLDRFLTFAPNKTPAMLFIEAKAPQLTTPELNRLRALTRTTLSLFEYKKAKDDHLSVVDLLDGSKVDVFERRKPAGLDSGDILEARLVPYDDKLLFSESFTFHPRNSRKSIKRAAKTFRKAVIPPSRVDFVHRVAYFTNRCERYKHVDPAQIFAELERYQVPEPGAARAATASP